MRDKERTKSTSVGNNWKIPEDPFSGTCQKGRLNACLFNAWLEIQVSIFNFTKRTKECLQWEIQKDEKKNLWDYFPCLDEETIILRPTDLLKVTLVANHKAEFPTLPQWTELVIYVVWSESSEDPNLPSNSRWLLAVAPETPSLST